MVKKIFSIILSSLLIICSLTPAFAETNAVLPDKNAILSSLFEADISTLREAIDLQIISCEELTSYYLGRIKEYNSEYNCFITLCDDALDIAKERDSQLQNGENDGILFGIPVVIKDNIDFEGYYTTNGHHYEKSEIATENATVVNYLLEQGAVIIGKTNMSTDAQDARSSYSKIKGETKNAYHTLLASGGSSGGTAVSVSLNFATAGLGTDTNSSLRIPAVLNGCVALRPTWRLIDYTGCTQLNGGRDVVGAVTRSVYDQAIMMDVLTNGEYSYTENLDSTALNGLKIGIIEELSYATTASNVYGTEEFINQTIKKFDLSHRTDVYIDSQVSAAFENAVKELKSCGAQVKTVSMPQIWSLSYTTFDDGHVRNKNAFYNKFEAFLSENDIDVVIFPSYLSTPLKSGTDENGKKWNVWGDQKFFNNCPVLSPSTCAPEISIPIGYHSSGAGIGLEIMSLRNCEQQLLNIAYSYEQSYNHREAPTGAPDMYSDFNNGTLKEIIDEFVIASSVTVEDNPQDIEAPAETVTNKNNSSTNTKPLSIAVPLITVISFIGVGITISAILKKKKKS